MQSGLGTVLAVGCADLARQAWRASVTYAADPRNPYVYAQTVPDAVRMATRIRALAALHPDGDRMQVTVIAPPHEQWPLPWYLRNMPQVGYWTEPGDALAHGGARHRGGGRHTRRPSTPRSATATCRSSSASGPRCCMTLYAERQLWDHFLARVR